MTDTALPPPTLPATNLIPPSPHGGNQSDATGPSPIGGGSEATDVQALLATPASSSEAPPAKPKSKLRVKTVFISDVHLGMPDCKAEQASHFIRNTLCEKLVMNGDIIDAWHLKRLGGWNKSHTHFIRTVLKKMEKENTEIIYLRGNHDDILDSFIPIRLDNFHITNEYIHPAATGDYLVVHGDGFDHVTTNHPWVAKLGGVGYNLLLRINRLYNWYRQVRGKEAFSLSRWVKHKVKSAVSFVGRYEEQLQQLAAVKNCKGIICGHIHSPANKIIGSTHYLNSGDWVESLTAVVEHMDGTFEVITYHQFCERTNREPKGALPPGLAEITLQQEVAAALPM